MPDHVLMMIAIPPKYAVSKWWDTSRARARSTWRGFTRNVGAISWGSIFGREDISYRPWVETKR